MNEKPLTDKQLIQYLEDGYVVFEAQELDQAFHERMFHAACLTYGMARGAASVDPAPHIRVIADNLRPRIPDVERLLASPSVRGALNSVLGDEWQLYPHDFIHESSPNDQSFHQDGNLPWNDRGHYRSHRPDWAMLFYYPQTTDEATGPTEVLPGTQYWTNDYELPDDKYHRGDPLGRGIKPVDPQAASLAERDAFIQRVADSWDVPNLERRILTVPCGGLVLASYDLAHRGTRTGPGFAGRRFMYKFYLYRTTAPSSSSCYRASNVPVAGAHELTAPIVEKNWRWLHGEPVSPSANPPKYSTNDLELANSDAERTRIAYELGHQANSDTGLTEDLVALLSHAREGVRRAAGYAFCMVERVEEALFKSVLEDERAPVRRAAVLALRESMCCTSNTVEWLFERVETDPDDLVRSNAVYALGIFARANATMFDSSERLIARLDQAVEPDNTNNGGMSRSTVRESVALALTMMRLSAQEIERVLGFARSEHDRYAKSLLFVAIQRSVRHVSERWVADLVDHLTEKRFVS